MDGIRFSPILKETFWWLQFHSKRLNIAVDRVDDVLVGPFVGGDEAEVICIRESDDLLVFKTVPKLILKALEVVEDWVKDHEEKYGAQWIALENSSFEGKWVWSERIRLSFAVEIIESLKYLMMFSGRKFRLNDSSIRECGTCDDNFLYSTADPLEMHSPKTNPIYFQPFCLTLQAVVKIIRSKSYFPIPRVLESKFRPNSLNWIEKIKHY